MKLAISSTGPTLDATIDPRIGRCAHFVVVDTETMDFEAIQNQHATLGQGAGIQAAQSIAEKKVDFVLTGNCGPNARETLSAAGIGVILNCSGPVKDVISEFKAGNLQPAGESSQVTGRCLHYSAA